MIKYNTLSSYPSKKDKNILIDIALIFFNSAIFFTDIFHSISIFLVVCLIILSAYLFNNNSAITIDNIMKPWILFTLIIAANIISGGDLNFIVTFIVCSLLALIMSNDNKILIKEYDYIKKCSFIHIYFNILLYVIPISYSEIFVKTLLNSSYSSNFAWREFSHTNPGISSQPGVNAFYLAIAFLVCLIEIKNDNSRKLFYYLNGFLSILMLITTSKRSPLIILLFISLLYCVNTFRWDKIKLSKVLYLVLGVILIYALMVYVYNYTSVFNNLEEKMSKLANNNDVSNGRFSLWSLALDKFYDRPFLGVGLKNIYDEIGFDVHNTYIQILAETGIIGIAVLLLSLFCITFNIEKRIIKGNISAHNENNKKSTCVIQLGYVIYMYLIIYGFFGNTFIDYIPLSFFTLSLSLMSYNERKDNGKID